MNNRIIAIVVASLMALVATIPVMGQEQIEKLVSKLEQDSRICVTYTEKRDPNTRDIIKQSIILEGHDSKTARKLFEAFEEERKNSISYSKARNEASVIKFLNIRTLSTYVLSIEDDKWSLVVTKRQVDGNADVVAKGVDADFVFNLYDDIALGFDPDKYENEPEEESEKDGKGLFGGLRKMVKFFKKHGNITVSDGNGNVLYSSTAGDSVKAESLSKSFPKSKSKSKL